MTIGGSIFLIQQRMWARRTAGAVPVDRVAPVEEREIPPERRY
jgi:hypothetical protein